MKAERRQDGTITIEEKAQDGTTIETRYQELRGGISWAGACPLGTAPHYFCIVGVEWTPEPFQGEEKKKGMMRLVLEGKGSSLLERTDFFRRLTDAAAKCCCASFYADIRENSEEQNPYDKALRDYVFENKIQPGLTLCQAPHVEDFIFGVGQIAALREEHLIDIPENTIAFEQLSRIHEADVMEFPEIRFFAVNALRHVALAFFKSPASGYRHYTPPRRAGGRGRR